MSIPATGLSEMALVVEGRTKILVPPASLQGTVATKREPVFFNSAAEFNRDISIIAYTSFLSNPNVGFYNSKNNRRHEGNEVVMADSLCGTGARGLRVAVEAIGIDKIYFNDANPLAVDLAKKSSAINQVKDRCLFSVNDVCKFLLNGTAQRNDTPATASCQINNEEKSSNKNNSKQRFTIVDLDPFGSPANYIDCAMRSVQNGGLVSVTATDTAVLCGKYPDVCLRKYYGMSLSNPYSNELALRLLMSLMALTSSRLGIGIRPLFAHTNMHYVRIYVQVVLSNKMANSVFDNIGYIQHCFRCGNRTASSLDNRSEVCGLCSSSLKTAGWLWTGKIYDKDFVKEMLARTYLLKPNVAKHRSANQDIDMIANKEYHSEETTEISQKERREQAKKKRECKKLKTVERLLSKCIEEYDDIPFYFTSDEIASRLKISPPSLETIIGNLSKAGFRTSPTGLNSTGFKTTGKINEIMTFFRR
jgi:tRNA (guanine26-N2/guanine27-N2)-dimethyltransferase